MAADFTPLDLLSLYRDDVLSVLGRAGIGHPRVRGLVARGADLPDDAPVEILVDVMEAQALAAVDVHAVADEIALLIAHPVVLVHCRPGQEPLMPGDQVVAL